MEQKPGRIALNRVQRILVAIVVTGALIIAAIGFAGSYAAVRDLAERKGFGDFAQYFPIGVDAGIAVLLALDLLLTWLRIPFPMLRQAAWLLTTATIAFNAAAAWPDPIGVGMHAVIPILFVVTVEAARHAVGRLAAITADKHMEGVRLTRWLLSPVPTFLLWRRMKLWELRSYDQVIKLEQERLVYQARLRMRFGRRWRRKAPVEQLLPLRMARYGVPLDEAARSFSLVEQPADRSLGPAPVEQDEEATDPPEPTAAADRPGGPHGEANEESPPPSAPPKDLDAAAPDHEDPAAPAEDAQDVTVPEEQPAADKEQTATGTAPADRSPGHDDSSPSPTRPPAATTAGQHDGAGDETDPPAHETAGTRQDEKKPGDDGQQDHEEAEPEPEPDPATGPITEPDPEHERAVAAAKTNAQAVRYAMKILNTTSTPQVVDWLAAHGRVVNRGQAHKITQGQQPGQQRLKVVKNAS